MIKKLDKLIIGAFIGPFIATFFITLFVLVLQFFWLYIDDIVGKGLDLFTIARFILYVCATLVPLALPLAVLLSSIMTFGNLGETFELVAIKSAGIPLLRFMRPLFITSLFICGIAYLFNNYIIPVAQLKMQTLKYDIIVSKPAFDIREGVFYDKIDGYIIKIGKKDKDGSTIRDILIFQHNYTLLQDFATVAESGKMTISPDKKFLEFNLKNGWNYQVKGPRNSINTELIRMGFVEYKKVFDLSSFKLNKTDDSAFKNNYQMLNMRQLGTTIDSIKHTTNAYSKQSLGTFKSVLRTLAYLDSPWKAQALVLKTDTFQNILPDSAKRPVLERVFNTINNLKSNFDLSAISYENDRANLRLHLMAWHEKITMSIACLVLFLIGAPLGSIIRKGGIGMPLIFAVIFFVIFFLLNNFGRKFVKEDVMQPIAGMWMATYTLLPLGIFLTYKAMNDSQLFNKEFYYRFFRKFRASRKKTEEQA
ncbi:MAG TPA: LptF/LptG family permease [Puia sp.]|nr:LptF/LptG family permease [Puia sp.]